MGSTADPDADVLLALAPLAAARGALAFLAGGGVALADVASGLAEKAKAPVGHALGLALSDWAKSPMLRFMSCKVLRVMRCTSKAWMVAAMAWVFWFNQNCTALSSWMRLSNSCGSKVGATQLLGPMPVAAPWLCRFFKKSKPGTNWLKSKPGVWLMRHILAGGPSPMDRPRHRAYPKPKAAPLANQRARV